MRNACTSGLTRRPGACRGAAFDVRAAHAVLPSLLKLTDSATTVFTIDAYLRLTYGSTGTDCTVASDDDAHLAKRASAMETDIVRAAFDALVRHSLQSSACSLSLLRVAADRGLLAALAP